MDESGEAFRWSRQELSPRAGSRYEADQKRWIAENTTPAQRIAWLFRMRGLLAEQILAARENDSYGT